MYQIRENHSLKELNSFFVDVKSKYYVAIESVEGAVSIAADKQIEGLDRYILGRGSNTLFVNDFDGIVIDVEIKGRNILHEDEESVTIELGAGEDWPEFVVWAAEQGWSGVENMAYIPGEIGAAPIQNIAAYGQTLESVFLSLDAVEFGTGKLRAFTHDQCKFEYRTSIFKREARDRYLITKVRLKLSKDPNYDTSYHSRDSYETLTKWLEEVAEPPYKPIDIVNAVTKLRQYKLPTIEEYGCCGSYFLNPFVHVDKFRELSEQIDGLQHYPVTNMEYNRLNWEDTGEDQIVKIPAGRLLDELGWKDKWIGNVGTFKRHALCVISNKEATGQEILEFAEQMRKSVKGAYDIELVSEVNVIGG